MEKKYKITDDISYDPLSGEFIRGEKKADNVTEPEIVYFRSDKEKLTDKNPATITWHVKNASDVRINKKKVASSGSMTFNMEGSCAVTLTAKNTNGRTNSKSIFIEIDNTPPVIHSFTANRPFTLKEQPVLLSWDVSGAEKIFIDNGVGDVSRRTSLTITPKESSVYHLTTENYFGAKSYAELFVDVFPLPLIKDLLLPRPQFRIELIAADQPRFDLSFSMLMPIQSTMPVFTGLDQFTKPDKQAAQILLNKKMTGSVLFTNDIFRLLIEKQKDISYIMRSLWKKKIMQLFKRIAK